MSNVKFKFDRVSTRTYYYNDRHTIYLAIRFNPNFIRPITDGQSNAVLGRFEILYAGVDYAYINDLVADDLNCFILGMPGPEKVYNFRGIEKNHDWNDMEIYVAINQINGGIIIHWDAELFEDETQHTKTLDELNLLTYKVKISTNRIEETSVEVYEG